MRKTGNDITNMAETWRGESDNATMAGLGGGNNVTNYGRDGRIIKPTMAGRGGDNNVTIYGRDGRGDLIIKPTTVMRGGDNNVTNYRRDGRGADNETNYGRAWGWQ